MHRGELGDRGHVVSLLDARGVQHGEAGLPHRHHVLVIAVDAQALRSQRARRHVEHHRGELTGDLVHIRNHQQQALAGGESGTQRSALQRAVQRTGCPALRLHFDHCRHGAVDIGSTLRGPFVGQFGHGRTWGDRVNAAQLVQAVGRRCCGFVAVDDYPAHHFSSIMAIAPTGHCSKQVAHPVHLS